MFIRMLIAIQLLQHIENFKLKLMHGTMLSNNFCFNKISFLCGSKINKFVFYELCLFKCFESSFIGDSGGTCFSKTRFLIKISDYYFYDTNLILLFCRLSNATKLNIIHCFDQNLYMSLSFLKA